MMRDIGHRPVDGQHQRLVWEPESVPRDRVVEALEALGLDSERLRSVMFRPDVIEVEEYIHDAEGHAQMHPQRDTAWTRVRLIPVSR